MSSKNNEKESSCPQTVRWDDLQIEILQQDIQEIKSEIRPNDDVGRKDYYARLQRAEDNLEREILRQEIRILKLKAPFEPEDDRMELDMRILRARNRLRALDRFPGYEDFPDKNLPIWQQIAALRAFDKQSCKEIKRQRYENDWVSDDMIEDPERYAQMSKSIAEKEIEITYMLAEKARRLRFQISSKALRSMSQAEAQRVYGTPLQRRLLAAFGRPYLGFRIFFWNTRISSAAMSQSSVEDLVKGFHGESSEKMLKQGATIAAVVVAVALAPVVYYGSNWVMNKYEKLQPGNSDQNR